MGIFFPKILLAARVCPISYCHKSSWFALEPKLTSALYEPRTFSIKLSNSNFSQYVLRVHFVYFNILYFSLFIPASSSSRLRYLNRCVISAQMKNVLLVVSKLVSEVSAIQMCCVIGFCNSMARQCMIYIVLCRIKWRARCLQLTTYFIS